MMMTISYAAHYGIKLTGARHLNDEEASHYKPEYRDRVLIGLGDSIQLTELRRADLPKGPGDYEFPGCGNTAWEITQEQWDAYLALDNSRKEAAKQAAVDDEIKALEARKARAEAQADLPTAEQAKRRVSEWIEAQNEGGEGYVPHIYSQEEYRSICKRLDDLRGLKSEQAVVYVLQDADMIQRGVEPVATLDEPADVSRAFIRRLSVSLPEGYHVSESQDGTHRVYRDGEPMPYELATNAAGDPVLLDVSTMPPSHIKMTILSEG